jgi:hypothetical protein
MRKCRLPLLSLVASLIINSSCGDSEEPEIDPTVRLKTEVVETYANIV